MCLLHNGLMGAQGKIAEERKRRVPPRYRYPRGTRRQGLKAADLEGG